MPARVVYLGPEGAFCHEAAREYFSDRAALVPVASIPAVFEAVARGEGQWGVVPIENSIEGGVNFTQDTLLESALELCGEVMVDIEQCLLTNAPDPLRIQRVYSHPQGLAQCRKWLAAHLPEAAQIPTGSTVAGAHLVKDDPGAGAIASRVAGTLAGVRLAYAAIQDRKPNVTRFVVLGTSGPAATDNDKTSLVFSTPHERGALVRALQIFDEAGINLCRIESRPRGGETWQYVFFVDLEGHRSHENVRRALDALSTRSDMVRVLGSYPRATTSRPSARPA
ncbi:MAG TPA: prephenate dehydratase [Polyangiaceae bacterium]|jgi:chorismate mutase/prephenate dehydratase|nr:prephenate dehydratase [Polyangiaceae bacterium]